MTEVADFNELWSDSWLATPEEAERVLMHVKTHHEPLLSELAAYVGTRKGSDKGRDYVGVIQDGEQRYPHIWLDLKQAKTDPGIGRFWFAVLTSPYSNMPGWALRDDSDTDYVVWHYRNTGRIASLNFKWLRKILSLRLRQAFMKSTADKHINILRRPDGRASGGALVLDIDDLNELAIDCRDEEYVNFATSVDASIFASIKSAAQKKVGMYA